MADRKDPNFSRKKGKKSFSDTGFNIDKDSPVDRAIRQKGPASMTKEELEQRIGANIEKAIDVERSAKIGSPIMIGGKRKKSIKSLKRGIINIEEKDLFLVVLIMTIGTVSTTLVVNFLVFRDTAYFNVVNLISAFILITPLLMVRYVNYRRSREIEEMFPVFLRDFIESIRGGMTIPHAIKSVSRNDYGALTPHVRKMAVQIDWGVTVDKVLTNFSKRTGSKMIKRVISSVRESHRFGGNLTDTLEALSDTAVEIERLREERRLYLNSQVITGYIIFFVFLAVIIALDRFLVPVFSEIAERGVTEVSAGIAPPDLQQGFKTLFRDLILIQGLFAGLAVGKMSEGEIVAGFKHSLIMMLIGSSVYIIALTDTFF